MRARRVQAPERAASASAPTLTTARSLTALSDYPPILDRQVAAGTHVVEFRWPDGARKEESVEVNKGALTYVTGRKE